MYLMTTIYFMALYSTMSADRAIFMLSIIGTLRSFRNDSGLINKDFNCRS